MNKKKQTLDYLQETLGLHPRFEEGSDHEKLPHILRSGYDFAYIRLLGEKFLLLIQKDPGEVSPAQIAQHLGWIRKNTGLVGILQASSLEAFNRKRLIDQKVPFIVPGNQLYLPDLGIDLRGTLKKVREKKSKLSPSAQLLLLVFLNKKLPINSWTATDLAEALSVHKKMNKMTMSRAIEDLEAHGIIEIGQEWREKPIQFLGNTEEIWEKVLPELRSPVSKRVYLEQLDWPMGLLAGLTALAEVSMLAPPNRIVRAVTNDEWKAIQKDRNLRIIPAASKDMATVELEIWKYDPRLLSESGWVDPLSLYLSLRDEKDERIEAALEELLEGFEW
jgi:DNA-binding MarR family transcriptional regulator